MAIEPTRLAISVAMCTRNGSRFVRQQVASILDQTIPVSQLVVSDDASADDTVAVIRDVVAASGADIELVVLSNVSPLGVTANFDQALRHCTGDLVALCDQDDEWLPDRIEEAVKHFAERERMSLAFSDAVLIDQQGIQFASSLLRVLRVSAGEREALRRGEALGVLLRRNVATGATIMIRRSLASRATPFPQAWVHDEWLAMVAALTGEAALIDAPLIRYRQHGDNVIGARSLTVGGGLGKLRAPRSERNDRLLRRAQALSDWVEATQEVDHGQRVAVTQKLAH